MYTSQKFKMVIFNRFYYFLLKALNFECIIITQNQHTNFYLNQFEFKLWCFSNKHFINPFSKPTFLLFMIVWLIVCHLILFVDINLNGAQRKWKWCLVFLKILKAMWCDQRAKRIWFLGIFLSVIFKLLSIHSNFYEYSDEFQIIK